MQIRYRSGFIKGNKLNVENIEIDNEKNKNTVLIWLEEFHGWKILE
jgi:hypothetical protein